MGVVSSLAFFCAWLTSVPPLHNGPTPSSGASLAHRRDAGLQWLAYEPAKIACPEPIQGQVSASEKTAKPTVETEPRLPLSSPRNRESQTSGLSWADSNKHFEPDRCNLTTHMSFRLSLPFRNNVLAKYRYKDGSLS